MFEVFPKQALVFAMCLQYKYFENTEGKGEIACNEQFLLFPQCFLPVWRTSYHFYYQIWNCCLQTLSVWNSLKFVVWERVKKKNNTLLEKERIVVTRYSLFFHNDCFYYILSTNLTNWGVINLLSAKCFQFCQVQDFVMWSERKLEMTVSLLFSWRPILFNQ